MFDKPGFDIAKEIHKTSPNQRIVIITTRSMEHLPKEQLDLAGSIYQEDIHLLCRTDFRVLCLFYN